MSDTASWGARKYSNSQKNYSSNELDIDQTADESDAITLSFAKDEFLQLAIAAHKQDKSVKKYILDSATNNIQKTSNPQLLIEDAKNLHFS